MHEREGTIKAIASWRYSARLGPGTHGERRCFCPIPAAPGPARVRQGVIALLDDRACRPAAILLLHMGGGSDAVARPPTVPSMTRSRRTSASSRTGGVRLSNQRARSGGAAASPRRATLRSTAVLVHQLADRRFDAAVRLARRDRWLSSISTVPPTSASMAVCSRRSRSRAIAAFESPRTVPRRSDERQQRPRFGMRR